MKIKEKRWIFVFLGLLILVLYTIFSSYPLKKDLHLLPSWTINIRDVYESFSETKASFDYTNLPKTAYPFMLGSFLGALDTQGELIFVEHFDEKASISKKYWLRYTADAKNSLVQPLDGDPAFEIKEKGFPFAIGDFLFNFFPGGTNFGSYDEKGNLLWTASQWSPITAFSVSSNAIAVGYVDGNLRLFSTDGDVIFSTYPAGSRYELIYGAALSSDTSVLAAISGLDKQRFVLYAIDGDNTKIIYHEYLENQQLTERFMQFNTDNSKIYYCIEDGLVSFELKTKKACFVAIPGKICSMQELDFENIYSVLSREENKWFVSLLNTYNQIIAQFSFTAEIASLFADGNALYLGRDESISKMELVRK
mgnify:CR=1 FL=1